MDFIGTAVIPGNQTAPGNGKWEMEIAAEGKTRIMKDFLIGSSLIL
jgi:hypothetical protein